MTDVVTITEPGSPVVTVAEDVVTVAVTEQVTEVRVSPLAASFATVAAAADVDMSGAITGSLLVYNASTQVFAAAGALDGLTLDGGAY